MCRSTVLLPLLSAGHSRGAINATLYSGQRSIPLPPPQQHHQQQEPAPPPAALQPPATATLSQQQESPDDSSSSSSDWRHIIPLVVLVAGRFDLTLNMHQRYGQNVLQQLQESGPCKQKTRRDKDGQEIHWELDAQVQCHSSFGGPGRGGRMLGSWTKIPSFKTA